MEDFLIYIGKASIAAGAFYLAYLLLFQNKKHFRFNRIYLPVSMLLSFVIPLITFTTIKYVELKNYQSSAATFDFASAAWVENVAPAFDFQWYHYLFGMYLIGLVGFLIHLFVGHLKAIHIIRTSKIEQLFNHLVNITKKDIHPFSFFNKIVLSEKTLSSPDLEMIVSHEKIHVREKHTVDILFTEILFLFQWFNPFVWLIKSAIRDNLEYKTDDEIAKIYNPQKYQLAMVALADKMGVAPFLNALNGSQLKNRIIMMKKKTGNKFTVVKQLIVLPLLALLVMGLSNKEVKTELIQPKIQNEVSLSEKQIKGKVTNEQGDPVYGVSVIVKGTNIGTITDQSGKFEITIDKEDTNLVFASTGYKGQEITIGKKEEINVKLEYDKVRKILYADQKNIPEKKYNIIIKGKVTDKNGNPLKASIIIKGKPIGTITDSEGNFQIGIENETETLVFVMAGYKKKEIVAKAGKELNVQLAKDKNQNKDSVKVIGYGQKGGSRPQIILRSTNGTEYDEPPLIVVDGKEYEGNMNDISPDEIDNITVLKDKSATELYGEKGKNGVILIETKTKKEFNPNDLLILVDGKEVKDISDLDPENIESIDVLKDKSATELYDEKGKNGVIIINTKTKYNSDKSNTLINEDTKISNNKLNNDIIIPEGFSPNGDGIHDIFEIRGLEKQYPNFKMKIVNSRGNLVWEYQHNGDPDTTPEWWDGKDNNNNRVKRGTYSFIIELNDGTNNKRSGNFILAK